MMSSSENQQSSRSADTTVQESEQQELAEVGQLTDPVENSATFSGNIDLGTDNDQPSIVNSLQDLRLETDDLVRNGHSHKKIAKKFERGIQRICKTNNGFDRWVPEEIYKPIVQRIVQGEYSAAWFETLLKLPHSRYGPDGSKYDAARDEFLNVALVTCMTEFEVKYRDEDLKKGDLEKSCSLYKKLLELFSQDELGNAMFKGKQQCLLTSIALHGRCDIIEYALDVKRLCHYKMDPTAADNKRCQRELNEIPLPQPVIQLLNKLTNMYITPHGKEEKTQQGVAAAKKYGFVYYNIIGRESCSDLADSPDKVQLNVDVDEEEEEKKMAQFREQEEKSNFQAAKDLLNPAEKEADTVLTWLHGAGFVVGGSSDWTVEKLKIKLEEAVKAIKDNCSVVVVFLMAHGYEGYVTNIDGTSISLDDLDDIINNTIPENIPKVFIVEACRGSAPDSNARKSSANGGMFSNPQPPQEPAKPTADPKDFIRVMASSKGQKAYRNVFLPLLIDEMEKGIKLLSAVANAGARMPRDKEQKPQTVKQTMWNPLRLQSTK